MPYTPPDPQTGGDSTAPEGPEHSGDSGPAAPEPHTEADAKNDKPALDPREERQVRLAAQRVLARHLRPTTDDGTPDPRYWGERSLDLTEATLIDLDLSNCELHQVHFEKATFHGTTKFNKATFIGDVRFNTATFNGNAGFIKTTFNGSAGFGRATFNGDTRFERAAFRGPAFLDDVVLGPGDRGNDVWPEGWRFDPVTRRLVREEPRDDAQDGEG